MTRIVSQRNRKVLERRGEILVGYLTAGYPDREAFLQVLSGCAQAGLDIFEVGFPAKNPISDGEVIQRAHRKIDPVISTDLGYWEQIRNAIDAPVWVMGYAADLIDSGFYRELAKRGLVDTFVLPDLDNEQCHRLGQELAPFQVDVMGFVNPSMSREEQEFCFQSTSLVYHQLYVGPTGMAVEEDGYDEVLKIAREYDWVRIFAGFGINTPQRVERLLHSGYDGVIMGTAMMKKLNQSPQTLVEFIRQVKGATRIQHCRKG